MSDKKKDDFKPPTKKEETSRRRKKTVQLRKLAKGINAGPGAACTWESSDACVWQ